MAQYGRTAYWDERYTKDSEPFDWYQRYDIHPEFAALIQKYIKKEDAILMAGCGVSRLSEEMWKDGYQSIVNIDVSRVAIDHMDSKYKENKALSFQQMNVCSLEFPNETFEAVATARRRNVARSLRDRARAPRASARSATAFAATRATGGIFAWAACESLEVGRRAQDGEGAPRRSAARFGTGQQLSTCRNDDADRFRH